MQKQKVSSNQVRIQIIGLLGLCQTGYNVTSVPTQHTLSFTVKPVCQIMYKNQIHSARPSINTTYYSTLCLSKTTQFPHEAQDLASTITCQWHAPHLLLGFDKSQLAHSTP